MININNFIYSGIITISDTTLKHLSPLVSIMAKTGAGTDECLKNGCLPMPVHFYSPIPDINDLEKRDIWSKRSNMAGIDFNISGQLDLIKRLGKEYGDECNWPLDSTEDPHQFYLNNQSFSFGCAASLHCIIRHYKPSRVIEVGSGMSSLIISSAIGLNAQEKVKEQIEYTIIDPYPMQKIENGLQGLSYLYKKPVENTDLAIFEQLRENDLLFIDSGHTVRIGGDVNYLILEVLPRLAPGVIVHFHDIPMPYEYPKTYAINPKFRQFWTESYLLQAFLSGNKDFEVLLGMSYLMTDQKEAFKDAFSHYDPTLHVANSGSFFIRRKSS